MITEPSSSGISINRTVRFGDTDGAGVMHFHQLLRWFHEAWEESIIRENINAKDIFPCADNQKDPPNILLPIVHCQATFKHPIQVGEDLTLKIRPNQLKHDSFQLNINVLCNKKLVAEGLVKHVAIDSKTRKRCDLPDKLISWITNNQ